jgi:UDP-glucose 4-epimerase
VPVLVTGGAGYVGSHVARELLMRGEQVVIVDLAPSPPPALSSYSGLEYVAGDIRDEDLIRGVFAASSIDSVVHLAALKSVGESMADPGGYFDNNVGGSLMLLRTMARAGVRALVFSSSCGVYGEPERLPVDESCSLRPSNPYGESKVLVERMLGWFDRLAGIRYLSLRYFNAAGASDDAALGEHWQGAVNLIPVVIEAALGRGPAVQILGTDYPTPDGTAIRDYIHVLDLADAHLRALDHLRGGAPSDVMNVGTGVGSSVDEVIAATAAVAGHAVPTIIAPRRAGDPAAVWANSSRAEQVLGWKARRSLPEIIESAWRWHARDLVAAPPVAHLDRGVAER